MKRCVRCCATKAVGEFGENPRRADGRNATCCSCMGKVRAWKAGNAKRVQQWKQEYRTSGRQAAQSLAWADKNRQRRRELHRDSYGRRRSTILAKKPWRQQQGYMRAWFAVHPGYLSNNTKRWRRADPERARATDRRMYAKRRNAPGDLTARQWKEIVLFYGHACAQCRAPEAERPLTIDHFIPLSKGGTHDWKNVWPLCLPCNATKHNKVPSGAPPHVAVLLLTAATKEATA